MEDQPIQENPLKVQLAAKISSIVATNNVDDDDDDGYLDSFPSGYRFKPFDGELIVYYLMRKINKEILPPNRIHDVNLYKFNPETLAERYKSQGEKEWYFFTPRDRKYRNGKRPNRAAGDGYWKATGTDKLIKFKKVDVGLRTALVFYKGRPPKGQKTNWIMHEFRIINSPPLDRSAGNAMRLDDCVLCKIYQNVDRSRCTRNRHRDDDDDDNGELPLPAQQYYNEQVVPAENSAMAVASEESFMPNEVMEMESDGYNRNANPNSFSRTCDFLPQYPNAQYPNGFLQVPSQLPFNHCRQVMTNPYLNYPNDIDMKPNEPALPLKQYPIHAMERNMRPFNQIDYPLPYYEPRGLDEEQNDWSLMLKFDKDHNEEMFASLGNVNPNDYMKLPHPGDNQ